MGFLFEIYYLTTGIRAQNKSIDNWYRLLCERCQWESCYLCCVCVFVY